MKQVKFIERGWAGHFIGGRSCLYHRNTLVQRGRKRIIVSTVGNYQPNRDGKPQTLGINRYYETMVFKAMRQGVYWEIDVTQEVFFTSNWAIDECEEDTDLKADKMHDKVVREIARTL